MSNRNCNQDGDEKLKAKVRVCDICPKIVKLGKGLGGQMKKGIIMSEEEAKETCPECRQVFRNKKALYGHMRLHPDRHWRGIRPPERPPLLPEWGSTAKRGRKAVISKEDETCANILLNLAHTRIIILDQSQHHTFKPLDLDLNQEPPEEA